MALTRAQIENIVIKRLKVIMTAAKMAVTHEGTNADLDDPLQTALLQMGLTVSSIPPAAGDFEQVTSDNLLEFSLRAQIETLLTILGNIEGTDLVMPQSGKQETRSQLIDQVNTLLKTLRADLSALLEGTDDAVSGTILVGGGLVLDFQELPPAWGSDL